MQVDLLVVGAGPAGLALATDAARLDLSVLVVDEQPAPGGQIYRRWEQQGDDALALLGPDYHRGGELVHAFRRQGLHYWPGTRVWAIEPGFEVALLRKGEASRVQAARVAVCAGAMERAWPFAGWTLPGVVNAGGGQILLKEQGLAAEGAVLAGCGPLLYLLAWQYLRHGRAPRAVIDLTPLRHYRRALGALPKALRAGHYLWQGLRYQWALKRAGVPLYLGAHGLAAEGDDWLQSVRFGHRGRQYHIETDTLLTHFGVIPHTALLAGAGCPLDWSPQRLCWEPCQQAGRTPVPGLYVAGDGAAILGARQAAWHGRLLARELAQELKLTPVLNSEEAAQLQAQAARDAAIRPFLEALYRPDERALAEESDTTLLCRCENVTLGRVRALAGEHRLDLNGLKAFSRCGMGPCQGRQCGPQAAMVLAAVQGRAVNELGVFTPRWPAAPLTLAQLASLPEQQD
ncbi:NAD(P)/FAD-dependent oxidoreductase [Oceanimonas pelagia]|uniref:NAD(P)/FAD-dependent oxidoreductase n=1 Tax=Oceanimonas pelagia TaxID=3028314 RepID=A0AA50KSM7_9GAMM|nr:NAD(P)/FAD-dependent oxidoreductase [Oceanimonas pelagia]WMC12350.1 NAD(P)/FAD-dependent oxidoreductase [Oceanimonas pelagia]